MYQINRGFGHHQRGRPYFKTLGEAIFKAPIDLSGDLWVNGQAAPIFKRRIRHLRLGSDRWGAIGHRENALNNFVARLRSWALQITRPCQVLYALSCNKGSAKTWHY